MRRQADKQCIMVAATMSKVPIPQPLATYNASSGSPPLYVCTLISLERRGRTADVDTRRCSAHTSIWHEYSNGVLGTAPSVCGTPHHMYATPSTSATGRCRLTEPRGAAAWRPQPVRALIAEDLPEMRDIESSSLHKAAQNCKHDFVRVPGDSNKLDYLRQVSAREQTWPSFASRSTCLCWCRCPTTGVARSGHC